MSSTGGAVDDTVSFDRPGRLDAFEAVGLEDLDSIAALQRRRDNKYLLDEPTGADVLDALAADGRHRILTIDGHRAFRYRSVYFDTDDLELYRAAVQRRRHRAKVRVRHYVETGTRFLEVKVRDRRGAQRKHRMPIEGPSTKLDVDMRRFVDTVVDEPAFARRLRPTAITSYRRITLHDPERATRATIDTDLTVFDVRPRPDGVPAPAVALCGLILESKFELGTADLDHQLWSRGVRPVSFSKYCTGLAALDDALPSNRWHRVLQQHFASD